MNPSVRDHLSITSFFLKELPGFAGFGDILVRKNAAEFPGGVSQLESFNYDIPKVASVGRSIADVM